MASTVSPNRMTLLALKRRYTISKRGLKLLKDKLEAMVKAFRDLYTSLIGKDVTLKSSWRPC